MNETYLAAVCHDIKSNTLEATWLQEIKGEDNTVIELRRVKCHSYSHEQKNEFLAETGSEGEKYIQLVGW